MPDTINYKLVLSTFSAEFRSKLEAIYGKHRLSAELVSREFNLRCVGCRGISRETARRWLTGIALPEYGRLLAVVRWLEIDISKIFPSDSLQQSTVSDRLNELSESDLRKALDKIAIETNKIKNFLETN
jgi:transcriptional regulator with XRE-family HTH domain